MFLLKKENTRKERKNKEKKTTRNSFYSKQPHVVDDHEKTGSGLGATLAFQGVHGDYLQSGTPFLTDKFQCNTRISLKSQITASWLGPIC